jgi:hypothetical protein
VKIDINKGMVIVKIEIIRAGDLTAFQDGFIKKSNIRSMKVRAIVDSGSYIMAINEHPMPSVFT